MEEERAVPGGVVRQVTVGELIRKCNAAAERMGVGNPHKELMFNCAFALRQLVHRLAQAEGPDGRPQ